MIRNGYGKANFSEESENTKYKNAMENVIKLEEMSDEELQNTRAIDYLK